SVHRTHHRHDICLHSFLHEHDPDSTETNPPARRATTAEIQVQPSTMAMAKATASEELPAPTAFTTKAAKKKIPVATEYAAQPDLRSKAKRRAKTKHAAMSAKNAIAALT